MRRHEKVGRSSAEGVEAVETVKPGGRKPEQCVVHGPGHRVQYGGHTREDEQHKHDRIRMVELRVGSKSPCPPHEGHLAEYDEEY